VTKHKSIYILGTGLSHDGSTCILKDGKILVAIEKERITRIKHDGGNDHATVQYCLDAAGITVNDLSLVVQCSNFEKDIQKSSYAGKRYFAEEIDVPFVTISHHLAHAYSAIGTSPFNESNVLIIDGCGSPYQQCDDLEGAVCHVPQSDMLVAEKDSYYNYNKGFVTPLIKDFSEFGTPEPGGIKLPTTKHSIGGLYSVFSNYVFGNMDDAGKLMGLAPYGDRSKYNVPLFDLTDGRVFVNEEAFEVLTHPSVGYDDFKARFNYFADIAAWAQKEVEKAVLHTITSRLEHHYHPNLCYAGGVALNAVANAKILKEGIVENLYIQPAAADNGLAIGCAYYGWLEVLKKEKQLHDGKTYFGRTYYETDILNDLSTFKNENPGINIHYEKADDVAYSTANYLANGKIVAWYQNGAEFGPRALGNRSILANPRLPEVQAFINREIKFREDFRPFAPSVILDDVKQYFSHGFESPYMILVDEVLPDYRGKLPGITHADNSARVQTVTERMNGGYYALLQAFKKQTGLSVLLNTSFNKRGMPIVETPYEAMSLFYETALDVLVIGDYVFTKDNN